MADGLFVDGQGNLKRIAFPSGDGEAGTPYTGYGGDILAQLEAVAAALGNLLAEMQAKADLDETQPVSAASLPLPDGASTADNQTALIGHVDGIEALLGAMDADTSALAAFVADRTITTQATTEADSGDNTVIAAPASGSRLVVSSIVVQNESATATTVLLKDGATTRRRALLQAQGDGVAWTFAPGREWRLGDAAALVLNLSGANSHGVTVDYWTESV